MEKTQRDDVAVFVDFENVYVSVREKFDATPNFELIMDRCEDYGRIVIARAYADWYRYPRVTSALFANGVEPMYVPTYYYDRDVGRTGRPIKNSVDIHLCIDVMRTLYAQPHILKYVLVTGDRDFIPLVNAIRQQGKEVIIIGIGGAASAHLAQSGDEFLFYEQIADLKAPGQSQAQSRPAAPAPASRAPERSGRNGDRERPERSERPERTERAPRRSAASEPAELSPVEISDTVVEETSTSAAAPFDTPETAAPEKSPYDTLVEAIQLARQRGFVVNLGSLKVLMRELDSKFHESRVKDNNGKGFAKFKDFVKEAENRGRVQIFTNGTVTEVFLPGEDPYRLSQFAEDLTSEKVEQELESELAQDQAANDQQASIVQDAMGIVPIEPASEDVSEPELAEAEQAPSAVVQEAPTPALEAEPATRREFADREWEVFRVSMSQFGDPVRFTEIFNALRGLRNQEVVELTNNELKELVKQAINKGMLQRTGRGAKAYYRLAGQYRVPSASGDGRQDEAVAAPEAAPPSPPLRRTRIYLAQLVAAAAAANVEAPAAETQPAVVEDDATAVEMLGVDQAEQEAAAVAGTLETDHAETPVETPAPVAITPEKPKRRTRRPKAAPATEETAASAPSAEGSQASADEQPVEAPTAEATGDGSNGTTKRRRRRKSSENNGEQA